jgi:hypothetical protein
MTQTMKKCGCQTLDNHPNRNSFFFPQWQKLAKLASKVAIQVT